MEPFCPPAAGTKKAGRRPEGLTGTIFESATDRAKNQAGSN